MDRVLIVDDDDETRDLLLLVFAAERWVAAGIEADDCEGAVNEAKLIRPDLVIVDAEGQPESHIPLIRKLRRTIPGASIFVLMEDYNFAAEKECLLAGSTAVFSKHEEPSSILNNARMAVSAQFG
jgi:DNA-binding response OmpR family regulator